MEFYNKSEAGALEELGSRKEGLTGAEAAGRLTEYGPNSLLKEKKKPLIVKFFEQFKDLMIIILLIAAVINGVFAVLPNGDSHGWLDSIIILAVVLLNAILGVTQEAKAENAVEALKKMSSAKAKVRRDGHIITVDAEEIVPGDIIILEAGDNVPCDLRLLETHSLKIEEAALTGESVPSEKHEGEISGEAALGDRVNMAFMGTTVVYGRGEGVAVGTGMNTKMGEIAHMLATTKSEATPLQRQMNKIGKVLSWLILGICVIIFVINILNNIASGLSADVFIDSFMISVSLAVAAIPEGLTAVITLVMTLGVTKMSKRNAIIRKLPSIETLGCAEIICSDKTGTLTQNKMTVMERFTLGDGEGDAVPLLIRTAALCNDSSFDEGRLLGDPTETALVDFAIKEGYDYAELKKQYPRTDEIPFDSVRKLMTTVNTTDGAPVMYVKGAVDEILQKCSSVYVGGEAVPLTAERKAQITRKNDEMAEKALRVLGYAFKPAEDKTDYTPEDESGLTFIGLTGMIDPVRPEVKEAVKKCFAASVTPIMITGDHLVTAVAIGKELGIITDASQAITGREIDKMSDKEFDANLDKYKVYARVSPENKVRIVKFWRKRGKICAMTGDGVNDAPALKSADIGIGMGITGTDVTKNVADMVLADDNFATIVIAVEEGRKIYDNIKKTVQFLLSSNMCEVLSLLIATLARFTILYPVQILWVNLVTDTVPALGIGLEKAESDVMSRPPRDPKKSIFADGMAGRIIYQSILMTALVITAYLIGALTDGVTGIGTINEPSPTGITMAFVTLSLTQIAHSFNLKVMHRTIFNRDLFKNRVLSYGALIAAALTFALVYIPGLNAAFKLEPLSLVNAVITLALSLSIIPLVEAAKLIIAGFKKRKAKSIST